MQKNLSEKAFNEASKYIPGGVNSPVRALKSVGAVPIFVKKADGATFTDIDRNKYIDFCLSWGVFIHGHNHKAVRKSVKKAINNGTSYGIPTLQETELARMVVGSVPSIEKVRFVSSGTEAVMSAIRVARGFTGRNTIIKFDGCYHGHADYLLVAAGSGLAQLRQSSSDGVPADFAKHTVSLPFNNIEAVKKFFAENPDQVAAVITEPVPANMGLILPQNGFLMQLREITQQYGALLIFDEVITGFRLSIGGAQQLLKVTPDLTTLGKIVGGGFPAAAFGGRADIMQVLAPDGPVYQAGTLSGNPIAMTAGIETINLLRHENFYEKLQAKSSWFIDELTGIILGKSIVLNHIGSMFTLFFSENEICNFDDAKNSKHDRFAHFFRELLRRGVYLSPSAFEANFISAAHSEKQLIKTLHAIKKVINNKF
jgi:glutamate-1-semialdehyde 2,1-aminomutase